MTLKMRIDDDLRTFTRKALKSFGFEHTVTGNTISLPLDDMCRLVLGMLEQHGNVHAVKHALRQIFPVISLCEGVDTLCASYHERFPMSDDVNNFVEGLAKEDQESLKALLRAAATAPPKDGDLN